MKLLQSRFGLLFSLSSIFLVITLAISSLVPGVLFYGGLIGWPFLILALFLGLKRNPNATKSTPIWWQISLLQWSWLAIFYGITQLCGRWLVNYSTPQAHLFQHSLHILLWQYGLFPWSVIAALTLLLTTGFSKPRYPHHLLPNYFHATTKSNSGLIINTLARASAQISCGIIIAFMSLALVLWLAPNTMQAAMGFQPLILILLIAAIAFCLSKQARRYWRQFATHVFFTPFIGLIVIVIGISALLFSFLVLSLFFPVPYHKSLRLVSALANHRWLDYWHALSLSFWVMSIFPLSLICSRLLVTTQRYISLIYLLIWPLIWSLLLILLPHTHWRLNTSMNFDLSVLLIGVIVLFALLSSAANWQSILQAAISNKKRPATKWLRNVCLISLLVIYLFWQSNVIGSVFFAMLFALPILLILLVIVITVMMYYPGFPEDRQ